MRKQTTFALLTLELEIVALITYRQGRRNKGSYFLRIGNVMMKKDTLANCFWSKNVFWAIRSDVVGKASVHLISYISHA